ncbi:hypothetical protein KL944_005388, partial [Ogataea haglerorum]
PGARKRQGHAREARVALQQRAACAADGRQRRRRRHAAEARPARRVHGLHA